MTGLSRLVRERDARTNTPRQLDVTARPVETKRICVNCRRVDNAFEHYRLWWLRNEALPVEQRAPYAPKSPCRDCGGRLVEVTF